MTKVTVRVHPFHLMNADWAPGGRQPSDQANQLGLWLCQKNWQLSSTSTIAIVIITQLISWYLFYRATNGGRLSRPRQCSTGAQPVPNAVYRRGCCDKHNCLQCDSNMGPHSSHTAVGCANHSATETCNTQSCTETRKTLCVAFLSITAQCDRYQTCNQKEMGSTPGWDLAVWWLCPSCTCWWQLAHSN